MNRPELSITPMEFESPVEFILVGVEGRRRAIVAKSKGAGLDLAAYAQQKFNDDKNLYRARHTPFSLPLSNSIEQWPLSIDSDPKEFPSNGSHDGRASELTLVWRGFATSNELKIIKRDFNFRADEIAEAIDNKSKLQLEWVLAPTIDQCNKFTIEFRSRKLHSRYTFWLVLLIYLIGIVSYFVIERYI